VLFLLRRSPLPSSSIQREQAVCLLWSLGRINHKQYKSLRVQFLDFIAHIIGDFRDRIINMHLLLQINLTVFFAHHTHGEESSAILFSKRQFWEHCSTMIFSVSSQCPLLVLAFVVYQPYKPCTLTISHGLTQRTTFCATIIIGMNTNEDQQLFPP
jgi:hypothetical protein